jgi:hypothetical protein
MLQTETTGHLKEYIYFVKNRHLKAYFLAQGHQTANPLKADEIVNCRAEKGLACQATCRRSCLLKTKSFEGFQPSTFIFISFSFPIIITICLRTKWLKDTKL